RHLRNNGVMRGVISTNVSDVDALVQRAKNIRKMDGTDLARVVSTKTSYKFDSDDMRNQTGDSLLSGVDAQIADPGRQLHVVAYDFGIKQNILRMLTRENCRVTVVPAKTSAEDVLKMNPEGVFSPNGPADPEPLDYAQENIRKLQGKT